MSRLNRLFFFVLFLILPGFDSNQDLNHFISGERLRFIIYYGPLNGGYVDSELKLVDFEGKKVFHSKMLAKTIGITDKLYKVRDEYQSYFDPSTTIHINPSAISVKAGIRSMIMSIITTLN